MCLPLAAAAPLMIASSVASAAGQAMQGAQGKAQAGYEAEVAKQNADLEIEAAHESVLAGQSEARDFWRKVGQTKGQQIAAMAANGIDVNFGSAARLQDDTQMLANEDAENLYRQTYEGTRGHYINASNYVSEAKAARARGSAAMTNGLFGAATSLLGGLSQAAAMRAKVAPGS